VRQCRSAAMRQCGGVTPCRSRVRHCIVQVRCRCAVLGVGCSERGALRTVREAEIGCTASCTATRRDVMLRISAWISLLRYFAGSLLQERMGEFGQMQLVNCESLITSRDSRLVIRCSMPDESRRSLSASLTPCPCSCSCPFGFFRASLNFGPKQF
jgi:hypothetical protein